MHLLIPRCINRNSEQSNRFQQFYFVDLRWQIFLKCLCVYVCGLQKAESHRFVTPRDVRANCLRPILGLGVSMHHSWRLTLNDNLTNWVLERPALCMHFSYAQLEKPLAGVRNHVQACRCLRWWNLKDTWISARFFEWFIKLVLQSMTGWNFYQVS